MHNQICILIDKPSFSAQREGRLVTGFEENFLLEKAARAGLTQSDIRILALGCDQRAFNGITVAVTMGENALRTMTGKRSIDKWHLSPLDVLDGYGVKRCVPTFDFNRIWKEWSLGVYMDMALRRAAQNRSFTPWERKPERYIIYPDVDEAIARLEDLLRLRPDWFSLDIETGRNQINTFGVAWTGSDAIAVKTLPDSIPPSAFYKLWDVIRRICESDVPKVMQNGIYERTYLGRYGIEVRRFLFDTMCANKFLWPELDKGLDNVGRIYTMEPYWKDDGRVATAEGKQKDWGDIRDWLRHGTYNCRDTSNTLLASIAQRADLAQRGLTQVYDRLVARLFDRVAEMGAAGLPLNEQTQARLVAEYEARSAELCRQMSQEINPRSPKAKLGLLRSKGYEIPKKRKTGKESTDELSLKKLRLKYPEDLDLKLLLEVAGIEKALSSYLRVKTLPDRRVRFMLDAHGTETGRMSCSIDPWGGGFNAQTMSDYVKKMIEWPAELDRVFVEVDLRQAETRFVAYDAVEETLLGMLERDEDIHRFVAAEIYSKPMADIVHEERQLGKKSGHGANYNMGVTTFQDSCLKEMDLVLTRPFATRVLESYHRLFPGVRRWHGKIRSEVYRTRKLTTPLGRERYFYGRPDDNTYREAYAYRPQSTVPDIANSLICAAADERGLALPQFTFHMQCHDSALFSCAASDAVALGRFALDTKQWHPVIDLPAGRLVIPTEVKIGRCLGDMKKFKG